MTEMLREQAVAYISEDLKDRPDVRIACLAIVEFISTTPCKQLAHISFGMLRRVAGLKSNEDVLPVAAYLSGARVPVLTPFFELVDGDTTEVVSIEELELSKRDNLYYSQITGNPVEDFEQKLFMHFTLSDEGEDLSRR